jgi:hypothetical protein
MKTYYVAIIVFLFTLVGCAKDPVTEPEPPIITPSSDSVIYKDGGNVILRDTIKKKWGDSLTFSWEYTGGKEFAMLLDGTPISFEKKGSTFIQKLANSIKFNAKIDEVVEKSYVFVAVGKNPNPTMTLSIPGGTLFSWGDSTTIFYSCAGDSADVNGKSIPVTLNGAYNTGKLYDTTTFVFSSHKNGLVAQSTVRINVAPKTDFQKITTFPYRKILSVYDTVPYGTSFTETLSACMVDDSTRYRKDFYFEYHQGLIFCNPGFPESTIHSWNLHYVGSKLYLTYSQTDCEVLELTEHTLVLYRYDNGYYSTVTFSNIWLVGK